MKQQSLYYNNRLTTISEYILSYHSFASTTYQYHNNLDFFFFNNQYYEFGAEEYINSVIRQSFPSVQLTERDLSKIVSYIQRLSRIVEFDSDSNLILYLNGVYNKANKKLYPFNPKYYLTSKSLLNQNWIPTSSSSLTLSADRLAMINAMP